MLVALSARKASRFRCLRQLIERGKPAAFDLGPIGGWDAVQPLPLLRGAWLNANRSAERGRAKSVVDDLLMGAHGPGGYLIYPPGVNPFGRFYTRAVDSLPK